MQKRKKIRTIAFTKIVFENRLQNMLAFEHRLKFNVVAPLFVTCIFRICIIRLLLLN